MKLTFSNVVMGLLLVSWLIVGWQNGRINDLRDQLAIARFAATENERVVDVLVEGNWSAVNQMKENIDSCNRLLLEQAQKTERISEKAEYNEKEIRILEQKIKSSGDVCVDKRVDSGLLPVPH